MVVRQTRDLVEGKEIESGRRGENADLVAIHADDRAVELGPCRDREHMILLATAQGQEAQAKDDRQAAWSARGPFAAERAITSMASL